VLILLECFLTFPSSNLVVPCLARTTLRVIDCIFGNYIYGVAPF